MFGLTGFLATLYIPEPSRTPVTGLLREERVIKRKFWVWLLRKSSFEEWGCPSQNCQGFSQKPRLFYAHPPRVVLSGVAPGLAALNNPVAI